MLSSYCHAIFLALSAIITVISGQPFRPFAGHGAYSVDAESDEAGNRWAFSVYSDGYTALDEEGNTSPVDTLLISKASKRLTVIKAMNGHDTTTPRLKMRQVLKECWKMTGLKPSELKEVLAYQIENENMKAAIAKCRTSIRLPPSASFQVSSTETDAKRQACWDRLGTTIFSASIQGSIADFGINKNLVQIKVDNGGKWDHVYYEFA
ncbi:hypothetical protein CORC01_07836 [Colletotrichum orchidophilum]|uniref:Uncharacterized protein n=1 Tax=Colletotrichum orchidophilum TaxID=1209926 RepID=A0A1G4B5Z9_9PEZI|nr:uncharacterized protein CORC01_07836 [Colletotrichum orchidophilum]OHE96869.1 hypothetical protein CORC01_07836 [Colletotrichum orchidophilum]